MALSTPNPPNDSTNIAINATLAWADSVASDYYKVYFGTNQTEVTAKSANVYRGIVYTKTYDPRLDLTYGATYYWLITAVKTGSADVDSALWSFTVISKNDAFPPAKNYFKKLCSVANNTFFYENDDSPPKKVALAGLTLDTGRPLEMFELNQKIYIVNDSILKVVDFVNTKLVLSSTMSVPPRRGQIISQANSGAQMNVDYVAKGDLTVVYGRTIVGTFTENDVDTLSGDTMSPTDLYAESVVEPTVPHHYDWDVYADVVDVDEFGLIPPRATMGDRWRGRACLTGNSVDPQQWYQSEPANPYNWKYGADNDMSPVAGGNAKATKVGDIVTAQIPYNDDYKIYGSIGSLWILRGDPAAGGSLDNLIEEIGIISNTAWCWDDAGNLYILDVKGLYQILPRLSGIKPLTSDVLPNFVKDLQLNPNTQRIVLAFDPARQGLQICVTEIETGKNQNYFYDLQSEGFCPETYPEEDGVFCTHLYNADDPENRQLLYGCKDGHIRIMDDKAKSDDIGSIASPARKAIDSYALLGPVMIGKDHDHNGKLNGLTVVSAGGKAGGSIPDSDDIDYEIFVGESAEDVMEKVDASPRNCLFSGTITAPGKHSKVRHKARGIFMGVRLGNKALDKTWGMERAIADILDAGRAK